MDDAQQIEDLLHELSQVIPAVDRTERAMASTRKVLARTSQRDGAASWRMVGRPKRLAAAAAVAVLIVIPVSFALIGASPSKFAHAEVVAQLEQAKTIQYLEIRSVKSPDGMLQGPTETTKVTVLGRFRERREIVSVVEGDPLPDGNLWTTSTVGIVSISDLQRGILVALNLKTKTFHATKQVLSISPDDGKVVTAEMKPVKEVDLYRRIRRFPMEEAEYLSKKTIDGTDVVGLRTTESIERKRGVDTWIRTYWIASESRLPVQVEVSSKSTDPFVGQSRWVLTDIKFNEPVDEELLSTEPPAGFKNVTNE